ncbi:MAG TPA: 23S rRNA (guanosine(2251)-2'-O)-methyltransferase RlmB [Actinomycetes bacterium]|nr:23S rRNA (guanosine(2251)-2'-O)-methyltransferase RlmB [Actinomycetes bacterium]
MAGNSKRKGAMRNTGSKKGPTVGSGGKRAKGLKGKGPTPKAIERDKHPVAKRARAAAKRGESSGKGRGARSSGGASSNSRRRAGGPEYVVGRNAVAEALIGNVPASALYVAERMDNDDRVKESVRLASDRGIAILEAPRGELDRLVDGLPHQGVVLQVPEYEYAHGDDLVGRKSPDGGTPLIVVLDHVTDPRNLGAVVRSAAAFGALGVVIPERRAAGMSAAAWKTSSGAAARIPVARTTNISRQLATYRKAGFMVIGLDAGGDTTIDTVERDMPLVLVVGAEGGGLSRLVREGCDLIAGIPMTDATESLNAGVAAGIALYAMSRNRP